MRGWRMPTGKAGARRRTRARSSSVVDQLARIEADGGDGEVSFGKDKVLHVSSLGKLYYPEDGLTKGDVMRYYATVAPLLLPHLQDRPLALTRFPEGIHGHTFYQQNAPKGIPDGVRVEEIAVKGGDDAERIVGSDLQTLLYLVQMGAIVIHSWFSRIDTLDEPDLSLIDLDPGEGVEFRTVVDMARAVRTVTDGMRLATIVKTTGSRGIHVGIPLPRGADYATAAAIAQRVADEVVRIMPEVATLERRIAKRPGGSILIDVNQNARGKTMVAPYALRARPGATASAPLTWTEVNARLTMERFTARSMPRRVARSGDLWVDGLRRRNTARTIAAALRT
jgi:bifunctional non-homologous end joining protein LigD